MAFTFERVGAEVPVPVQRVDGIANLLLEDTLSSFVAEHRSWEVHFNPEYSLGRGSTFKN